ncbi:MAG TPA: MBL fold metallo-hydrolase [Pseudogracilibacillus sp.]|nr:MBL fold metallo-hydrolase [Pseudogracilibacillus sp.]
MKKQTVHQQQGITEILKSHGLHQVTLNLPFRLDHVNCFMAEGKDGWKIIDTGLHNEETVTRWRQAVSDKDITDIIISHYHPDHFGYAGGLQEKTEAKLSMTKTDADAAFQAWDKAFLASLNENYKLTGIPQDMRNQMSENTESFTEVITPYPKIDHYLTEGETLVLGKHEYEVIHTPGHSDGLVCFYNQAENILISTDHVLPKITPNISYWFHGDANPLNSYLKSLEKVKKLDADLVIPSHGTPFFGANERINEIISHHEERLAVLLDGIKEGVTIYEACSILFKKELTIHETRFAVGETFAHLEYLRHQGKCQREVRQGVYWFTRT